jgi:hypothetical protein
VQNRLVTAMSLLNRKLLSVFLKLPVMLLQPVLPVKLPEERRILIKGIFPVAVSAASTACKNHCPFKEVVSFFYCARIVKGLISTIEIGCCTIARFNNIKSFFIQRML